jgi:xanthine dehydrogenase accessory factor
LGGNSLGHLLCLVRGGGDLATGVIYRLHRAGFPVVALELAYPRAVRRAVSAAEAVYSGRHRVEGMVVERIEFPTQVTNSLSEGIVPILVDPKAEAVNELQPVVFVDGRMKKRNIDIRSDLAPLVIGLGPGYVAGENCHVVVETMRGHMLGRVYWSGNAKPDTGVPERVAGFDVERVLRAPVAGNVQAHREIGEILQAGDLVATIEGQPVTAPFAGVLRGIVHSGVEVAANEKIGDLDPRNVRDYCYLISDKSLAIGGGVLEAVLFWLSERQ